MIIASSAFKHSRLLTIWDLKIIVFCPFVSMQIFLKISCSSLRSAQELTILFFSILWQLDSSIFPSCRTSITSHIFLIVSCHSKVIILNWAWNSNCFDQRGKKLDIKAVLNFIEQSKIFKFFDYFYADEPFRNQV